MDELTNALSDLTLSDRIGAAVAFGTLALAAVTFFLARSTATLARHTDRMAGETKAVADATRDMATETKAAAEATRDMAKATEEMVGLERERREEETAARVVPLSWKPGNIGGVRGLVVVNDGQNAARDVYVEERVGGEYFRSAIVLPSLGPGERSGFVDFDECDPDRPPLEELRRWTNTNGRRLARAFWKSATSDTPVSGPWTRIQDG